MGSGSKHCFLSRYPFINSSFVLSKYLALISQILSLTSKREPNGSTPLDFAYRIHTEVGNHTVGALVNGKIVPLTYRLKTGDVCEIKTSKNFNGPTEQWVKIVKTTHAKHKIVAILNKRKRDSLVLKGQNDFEITLKTEGLDGKLTEKLVIDNFSKKPIIYNNFSHLVLFRAYIQNIHRPVRTDGSKCLYAFNYFLVNC